MCRLRTVLGFMSVAGLICIQSAGGSESRLRESRPNGTPVVRADTEGEVFHAISNRSPSVVSARKAAIPKLVTSTSKAVLEIQQISAGNDDLNQSNVNPVVFASHPICRVKYSEQVEPSRSSSGGRNYANLSPSPCEKLTQATPLVIDTSASAPVEVVEVVDAVERPTYLDELNQLAPNLTEVHSATAADSYVSELNSLLHGPSPWILARGGMLDLRPEEPEPVGTSDTYVNELQSLVSQPRSVATQRVGRTLTHFTSAQQQKQVVERKTTYVIPQQGQGFCETPGFKTVDGLFAPLSVVGVSGNSTAPPEVPREAKQLELDLPENFACSYMQSGVPTYYMTRGYGTRPAPRNTHKFYNNPLYFEDPNLERCGQSNGCLTTFTSAIQFATMAALLPYQTASDHPRDCVPALPDCPTCQSFGPDAYFPEWSWKAAAVQGAAVTGLIFIIP